VKNGRAILWELPGVSNLHLPHRDAQMAEMNSPANIPTAAERQNRPQ